MPESSVDDAEDSRQPITPTVTLETLEKTPERVLTFLRAVGLVPAIHAILSGRGYTPEDHREGWDLLHAASGHILRSPGPQQLTRNEAISRALAEIDDLDETFINIIGATLRRRFPEIADEILEGIKPARGAKSLLGVREVLDRLDKLEQRDDPKGMAALELLGQRGYDKAERERIRGVLELAESVPDVVPVDTEAEAVAHERYVQDLARLRAWYEEWSTIARNTIHRRDHLIRLGLASRRPSTSRTSESGEDGENADEELDG